MSNSLLFFTQGIRNCQHVSFKFVDSVVYETIQMREHLCPLCHKASNNFNFYRQRQVIGVPIGTKPLVIKFPVHRVYCDKCRKLNVEEIPFPSHPKRRNTRALEKTLTELRSSAGIAALSYYFGVDWETVKNVEKEHLRREYRYIPLKDVESIGIDEIFVGRNLGGGQKYLTVVRDLKSGAVLHVGDGRGVEAMKGFEHKLRHSKADIKYIAMDMSGPYSSWAAACLPNARIVYDHFHVIRKMNQYLDAIRRRSMAEMDSEQQRLVRKRRYLFQHN